MHSLVVSRTSHLLHKHQFTFKSLCAQSFSSSEPLFPSLMLPTRSGLERYDSTILVELNGVTVALSGYYVYSNMAEIVHDVWAALGYFEQGFHKDRNRFGSSNFSEYLMFTLPFSWQKGKLLLYLLMIMIMIMIMFIQLILSFTVNLKFLIKFR